MELLEPIIQALDRYTEDHPEAREHDAIKWLAAEGIEPFPDFDLKYSRSLFSAHFLVRHCLYRLQQRGMQEKSFVLSMTSVKIQRQAYYPGVASVSKHDPVRDYYLNIDHYFDTTEQEVNELLNDFWQRFALQDDEARAYEVLKLERDASLRQVMSAYRTQAQTHHPDKGGQISDFLKIQAAKDLLVNRLRNP